MSWELWTQAATWASVAHASACPSHMRAVRQSLCSGRSCLRFIHASLAPAQQVSSEENAKPAKTNKSYAQLPRSLLLPDGTPAKALPPWNGGLLLPSEPEGNENDESVETRHMASGAPEKDSVKPQRARRRKAGGQEFQTALVHSEPALSDKSPAVNEPKPKRGRSKKAVIEAEELVPDQKASPEGSSTEPQEMPKRIRQKRSLVVEEEAQSMLLDPSSTAYALSLKKPRKSRSKAARIDTPTPEDDGESSEPRTALANSVRENLSKFPHCILLTRVGQFYESYFDQAPELARLLGIKLASRMWGGKRVFMAGFPLMHLDKHLKALVQTHARCVALCEEFPRAHLDGGGFERRVVRVVTPGTLLDESFVDPYTNNYLLAVSVLDGQEDAPADPSAVVVPQTAESLRPTTSAELGLAWIDVSTGEFFAKSCPLETLRDELVRLVPREVVLSNSLQDRVDHPVRCLLAEEGRFVSYVTPYPPADTQPTPYEERSSSLHDPVGDEAERSLDNLAVSSHLDSDLRDEMPADDLVPEEELTVDVDTDAELPSVELSATRRSPSNSDFSPAEDAGIRLLTSFLSANLLEHMPRLSLPSRESSRPRMRIDAYTLTSLEIRQGLREGGVTGSLLSSVKRTTTGGGARLLARWLAAPSTSAREIRARQALVAHFHARPHLREDLRLQLAAGGDASRLVQRLLARRGDAADLAALAETIAVWAAMRRAVALEREMEARERGAIDDGEWASLDALMARMSDLQSLGDRIELALQRRTPPKMGEVSPDEEGGQRASEDAILGGAEVWTIKPEFTPKLAALHTQLQQLMDNRLSMERDLQLNYDAPSLTLKSSRNHGMHVHIARSKRDASRLRNSPLFVKISESGTTCSFFHKEWSILGAQMVDTSTAIFAAEREAFEQLRAEVNSHSGPIRRNARILDELDVTIGFADLAAEMQWVRPTLTEDEEYHVVNGRHPTVELGLLTAGRVFTPNTVSLGPGSRLHVITGPNMAGKSTLLRQTALIAVLAQAGSFVPADAARLGVVDQLFSRVGAKDDLFRDRSTFMVEMLETAEILRRATSRSLVIMDEVGRGTTVKDGLAIAFSTIMHLHRVSCSRTLFATHFHELADMLGYPADRTLDMPNPAFKGIDFFCTDVEETSDGHFSYSHRLRSGVNRDSHGIKVARLASMPQSVIDMAEEALAALKAGGTSTDKASLRALGQYIATTHPVHLAPQ